ncbi:MAG TPA: CDP-6-deoxy-delta-3,4-glucoseen reductase [Burkholderiales bacterium]|nr:CDP-6-deoxy-delta-3,4-glucoseen reductase [Burkholderiales bacterium]
MSYTVIIQPSGNRFEVAEDETVLHAAIEAGFRIPYGCRAGSCGSCKGKLLAGEIDYGVYQQSALSQDEREAGYCLFCVAKPRSDLSIESREISAAKDIVVKKMPCRVQRLERLTDDVMLVELKLPANEKMNFLAGQYIEFILKDGSRRSFSMANASYENEAVQLHIRQVAGGSFTEHVFGAMKERDILRFEGPLGNFFLREEEDKPIVFVASGTGFAPIKSIIESALAKGVETPMTLYWGGRRPKDLYLSSLPERWAREYANFSFVPVISEAQAEDAWQGRTGFVHQAVMADLPDLSGYQVYACGVPVMVEAARRDFTHQCGLPLEAFHADAFTTAADLARDR